MEPGHRYGFVPHGNFDRLAKIAGRTRNAFLQLAGRNFLVKADHWFQHEQLDHIVENRRPAIDDFEGIVGAFALGRCLGGIVREYW